MKHVVFHTILFIYLLLSTTIVGQNRWLNVYHDDWNAPIHYLSLSYDQGYLIAGRQEPNNPKYTWMIKTDINGGILWEKMFGDGISAIYYLDMAINEDGEMFLCGGTKAHDSYGDPIVMKVNACGEKEWCKILSSPGDHDFAHRICTTPDGGCATTLNYTGTVPGHD